MTAPMGGDPFDDDPFADLDHEQDDLGYQPKAGGLAAQLQAQQVPFDAHPADRAMPDTASFIDSMNPEQRAAVETTEGPVLVLAGAGTGKTRVLTTRIAHLLASHRAYPSQILAVTFTNKAAREMRERIGNLIGPSVEGMAWLGTFHSIGVKILRRHAELVGLKSDFTILDTDDQIRLLKQVIRAMGLDDKRWPARQLAMLIDGWKNKGWSPKQVPEAEGYAFANGLGVDLYKAYQARLKTLNAADFGDLLLECLRLFQENPDVLQAYHKRFKYLLVDEYQDTNIAQYLWLRLLAQGHRNVCCVGDDDQSIYGWRGAEVDNILKFEKDFPGATIIRLERNYRSTGHILNAAAHLIAHNEGRLGKTLFTDDELGEKLTLTSAWDSEEEARSVGEEIEQLQRQDHSLNEIAILVRASFQMREFEDRFVTLGLNYRVIGGPRFYERMEIRDAMAYLRATIQPADDLAFERIVNTPRRGLGEATLREVHTYARSRNIPLLAAAGELVETEELKPRARNALKKVVDMFARWQAQIDHLPHTDLAEMILDESGYTEMWQNDKSAEAPGRLENLKELIRSMDEFENLRGFLEHVSLVMDADQNDQSEAVTLMTLHAAKGLEFDTVFLPGWEEGLFPHQRALDESGREGLEEERRLAYVGITRAKKRARIRYAANRRIHGLWQNSIPSRFLDELPAADVEVMESSGNYGGYNSYAGHGTSRFDRDTSFAGSGGPGWQRAQRNQSSTSRQQETQKKESTKGAFESIGQIIDGEILSKKMKDTSERYTTGERVFHVKFGYGRIERVEGHKLTVDFEKAGRKKVIDSFVERH